MKRVSIFLAVFCFFTLFFASYRAPEFLTPGSVISSYEYVAPFDSQKQKECLSGGEAKKTTSFGNSSTSTEKKSPEYCASIFWMGTDRYGIPIVEYATQGAKIVLFPSLIAGLLTCLFAIIGGLLRCLDLRFVDSATQIFA